MAYILTFINIKACHASNTFLVFSFFAALGRTCFAEIRVRLLKKRCPAIEKELAYILNNFASSLDEMPLSYTPFSLDKLEHHSLNSDSKMDLRMIKETKIPYIYPHLSKLINDISEKLQHLISPYNRDYVRSSEIIVQYLLSFIENLKKNYNIRKLRFDWKESIVIYVAFDDVFDKNKFIDHRYLLRERTGTMFSLIFEHVNNIRLDNPFIEINTLTMSGKKNYVMIDCKINKSTACVLHLT